MHVNRVVLAVVVALATLAATAAGALAATAPSASTGRASAVTPQTATVNGRVNPHGAPTAFYFQFGQTTRYGKRTSTGDAGSGGSSRAVSAPLAGLRPNTTYHYRLVAFSSRGTARGGDRKFKTPQIPTTSSISASPNPAAFGGTVSVAGSLTGPNIGGKQVALQGRPFPYTGQFQQIGNTVLTNPQGGYSFLFPALTTTQLRVSEKSKPSVMSQTITENVALATTLHLRRSRRSRHRIRFFGRVRPARVGNAVLIQRKLRRRWKTIGLSLTHTGNAGFSFFSKRLRLGRGGTFRVVVRTTGGDYVDGTSRNVRILLLRHRHRSHR
jgi:hypothetical protein